MTLSAEDHAIRKGRITGSMAAAVLGLDPFSSPLRAWLRCMGKDPKRDDEANARLERGHVLEPALVNYAASKIATDTGSIVAIDRPPTIAHPSLEWAATSIDAVYLTRPAASDERRGVVELDDFAIPMRRTADVDRERYEVGETCEPAVRDVPDHGAITLYGGEAKTVDQQHAWAWGETWTDQIPQHVAVQCEWELLHYPEAEAIVIPALIGAGLDLRLYWWQTDPELRGALVHVLGAWHRRHVLGGEPPPAIPGDSGVMARVWTPKGTAHPDDPRVAALVRRDCAARAAIKQAEGERDAARVGLASILREHTECRGLWGSVTWRANKGGGRTMTTRARSAL